MQGEWLAEDSNGRIHSIHWVFESGFVFNPDCDTRYGFPAKWVSDLKYKLKLLQITLVKVIPANEFAEHCEGTMEFI